MDINVFINNLKVLADSKADESVINKALISFEQNVCANLFSVLRNNFTQSIFMNIFQILFGLSLHEVTSIKLESSRAMSIFLTRLLPYYNELLQKSYSKVIEDLKIRTPLVPASFAFMSKHVSQPLLLQYINITPIVDQFQVNDPCFAFIIDNMGQLGNGFLQYLLKKLIEQLKTDPNRHLFRAIGAVIKHSTVLFLPQILNLDFLTLFAYIFLNIEFDYTKFNISHVVDLITKTLQSSSSSPLERDCAYQILSTLSPKVSISQEDPNLIDITFCDSKITLDPKQNLDRPPFFLLPLPLNLLQPKENESVLTLSSKFKTIAKSANEDNITEILSIFRKSLSLPYDESSSAAILGLSTQPKRLNSPELINMVIYKKSVSWFHSIDILRVIKSFQIVNVHTLNLIYEFLVSGNVKLSEESIETIKSLTNSENSEMIENFFSQKVDLFDYSIFERILTTLVSISDKSSNKSYLNFLSKILLEEIDLHKDNVPALSLIFNFLANRDLSFVKDSSLVRPCKIAIALCEAYLAAIYGDTNEAESNYNISNGNNENGKNQANKNSDIKIDFKHFCHFARKDVLSMNFDIVNEEKNYGQFYPNFLATVKFIFSLPIFVIGVRKAIDLSSKIFTFFPKLCSSFYSKNWTNIDETLRMNIMQTLFMKLQFVSDDETIAIWCKIALRTIQIFNAPQISKTIQSLNFTCATLLTPNLNDMKSAAAFAAYLFVSIAEQHKKNMEIFISNLSDDQKAAFKEELANLFENKMPPFFATILSRQSRSEVIEDLLLLAPQKVEKDDDEVEIKINEEGFAADMNRAILKGNSADVIRQIEAAIKGNIPFNLFDFNYPSNIMRDISKWASSRCSYSSLKSMISNLPLQPQNGPMILMDATKQPQNSFLIELLNLARTEWKPLVISYINGDPDNSAQLLNELNNSQKVKYNTILNVSSIMANVYFDSSELFKLAARVALHAEKLRKMRSSYLFLAHALSVINRTNKKGQFKPRLTCTFSVSIPDSPMVPDLNSLKTKVNKRPKFERFVIPIDFPKTYMNRINSFFDSLPHREVALSLAQITANLQKVDAIFLFFCRKLLMAGSKYMQDAGLLCSILITRYDELISVNKSLSIDFDEIVQNQLNFSGNADSDSESNSNSNNNNNVAVDDKGGFGLFFKNKSKNDKQASTSNSNSGAGRRKNPEIYWSDDIIADACCSPSMFLSACRIINSLKQFKSTLHSVMSGYRYWHRIPYVNKMIIKSITRDVWHERFRYMKRYFDKIGQSDPEYKTILSFASFVLSSPVLQQKSKDDEMCVKSFSIFSETIERPTSRKLLNTALCCLIARLNFVCVADNDKGQTMVMDALIEWLSGLDKKDGPLTLFFAFDFAKILEMKMDGQSFFALIACQYIRCAPRFFTVFPVVAKYYLKYKKCQWAADIIKSSLPFLKSDCHKKAILFLICGNIELALRLALFEKDCDESSKLIQEHENELSQQPSQQQKEDQKVEQEQQQQEVLKVEQGKEEEQQQVQKVEQGQEQQQSQEQKVPENGLTNDLIDFT